MTNPREVMQQALEAQRISLNWLSSYPGGGTTRAGGIYDLTRDSISALEAALAAYKEGLRQGAELQQELHGGKTAEEMLVEQSRDLNCAMCGGSGHVDDALAESPAGAPEGQQWHLDSDAVDTLLQFIGHNEDGEGYAELTFSVGHVIDDDGTSEHGLRVSLTDYPEEGSVLLAASPPAPKVDVELYAYIYETDSAFGVHRSLDYGPWNGRNPDRTIKVYASPPAPLSIVYPQLNAPKVEAQPLTDEEVKALIPLHPDSQAWKWTELEKQEIMRTIRAVEAAVIAKMGGGK